MEYYEKREYSDGIKYVPVTSIVPGRTYYSKTVDTNNQVYFSPASAQPVPQMTYANTGQGVGYPQPSNPYPVASYPNQPLMSATNPALMHEETANARALHLGITITSIFIPTLIYLIGYPFCFHRFKKLSDRSSNPAAHETMKAYTGVGWTCWVLQLGLFVTYCTWWIPVCYSSYSSYSNYYYYNCYFSAGGIIALIAFSVLAFIFTIVIVVLGGVLSDRLMITGPVTQYQTYA